MLKNLKDRYSCSFYRIYPWQNAIETEFLFFAVCDVMFLHSVKNISFAQISFLIFFSLLFSLIVQYPLLKCIHRMGNRNSVRAGSLFFLLSALCITFAPNYGIIVVGGILKCIGHTFNSLGAALLKEKLVQDGKGTEYVNFQSDANNAVCLLMMISSFACGFLYSLNPYYPMFGCITICALGVILSFLMTSCIEADGANVKSVPKSSEKQARSWGGIPILVSFAVMTAITGIGLSYARINFQEVLTLQYDGTEVMSQLGYVTFLVFLFRFLSNVLMSKFFVRFKRWICVGLQILLVVSLVLQILPWVYPPTMAILALMAIGYLVMVFVRDPYITAIQNDSLMTADKTKRQNNLILLNVSKKAGALLLSAVCTLILRETSILPVMTSMITFAVVSLILLAVTLPRCASSSRAASPRRGIQRGSHRNRCSSR